MKKRILFLLLLLFIFQNGWTQKFEDDNTYPVYVGVLLGYNWHTSDVRNVQPNFKFPVGFGGFLGISINRNNWNLFSYDIRLKLYGGSWYGQDEKPITNFEKNIPLNEVYKGSKYVVQNFRAYQFHSALEVALHMNRLKQKTNGLDPYVFAGFGVTVTNTYGDLLKDGNTPYSYTNHFDNSILNKNYETGLLKNKNGDRYGEEKAEISYLPSLGIGIGYYFSNSFSMALEHTTTFFLSDYFDGSTITQKGIASHPKKDLYHFTSLTFRWYFKRKNRENHSKEQKITPPREPKRHPQPRPKPTRTPRDNNTRQPSREGTPPKVDIVDPNSSYKTVNNNKYVIKAHIRNVQKKSQLTVYFNNKRYYNFYFTPSGSINFSSPVTLQIGTNRLKIIGKNNFGSDSDNTNIIYRPEREPRSHPKPRPKPTRTPDGDNPRGTPTREPKRHPQPRPKPTRTPRDNNTRQPSREGTPPKVDIVDPSYSYKTVSDNKYIIKARIRNVQKKGQLTVYFNNKRYYNFHFTPTGSINFSSPVILHEGTNSFKIIGTNNFGSDSDDTRIIYRPERKPSPHPKPRPKPTRTPDSDNPRGTPTRTPRDQGGTPPTRGGTKTNNPRGSNIHLDSTPVRRGR